ncbi:glycosyltransferase [Nocardioides terrae]|uniref:glycosyltransferase n=1 Tax=Nocardioides terrae TaxID=574651 RepID=UPI001587572B|nr:glycosyltransferase [Nocardioides terrae]
MLLLTKTDFTDPRDGGTLRVAAVESELRRRLEADVRWVCVEERTGQAEVPSVGWLPQLIGNLRVLLAYLRIGSLSAARWYRPRVVRELLALQAELQPTVRVIEYSQLLGYRALLKGPVVLDMHNVESELMANYASSSGRAKAWLARYEAARLRWLERRLGKHADVVGVVSEHDRHILQQTMVAPPRRLVVAPNGVADAGFGIEAERGPEVVFVAHLGWAPNVDAAEWLCEKAWPEVVARRPDARLSLVGRSPAKRVLKLQADTVRVVPDVPSVLPYVAGAAVATAPLLAAGGTRLKILEALSCGTPVVATTLGALGLEHVDEAALLVRDDPSAFADAVLALLARASDAEAVRRAAEPFRWASTLDGLVAACRDAV